MKKAIFFLLLVFLFPISVLAKTTTQADVLKIIDDIENVQVDEDGTTIKNTTIDEQFITFTIESKQEEREEKIPYFWSEPHVLSFSTGKAIIQYEQGVPLLQELTGEDAAFYLYSILENKSLVPYSEDNYYSPSQIKKMIEYQGQNGIFKNVSGAKEVWTKTDPTKTFGISFQSRKIADTQLEVQIIHHYYLETDYPINEVSEIQERISEDTLVNPNTGNYGTMISIMLVLVLGITVYTIMDIPKKRKE